MTVSWPALSFVPVHCEPSSHTAIVLHSQQLQNISTGDVKVTQFRPTHSKGIAKELTVVPAAAQPSLPPSQLPSAQREAEWIVAAVKEALSMPEPRMSTLTRTEMADV
jgi:hypothetical protein